MLVVCPAFVGDCLESVEQIGMRAKAPSSKQAAKVSILSPA